MNNYALPKFILHLLRYEGSCIPAEGETNEQAFERCRQQAFANDPNDPGGATMMGITMPVFREWRQTFLKKPRPTVGDLQDITYDEWAYLVETVFWKMYSLHTVPYE